MVLSSSWDRINFSRRESNWVGKKDMPMLSEDVHILYRIALWSMAQQDYGWSKKSQEPVKVNKKNVPWDSRS